MNSDFKDLLSIFNEKQVKYLIIGGYAVSEYAEPRYKKLWIFGLKHQKKMAKEFLRL